MRTILLVLSAMVIFPAADCGYMPNTTELVYINKTDYEVDFRGSFTIPPMGRFEESLGGGGVKKGTEYEIQSIYNAASNGTSSVVRFKDLKTGKTVCYNPGLSREKAGKYVSFYDYTRYTFEDLSTSARHLKYRYTYTITDEDLKWADEETCQWEDQRIAELEKKRQEEKAKANP